MNNYEFSIIIPIYNCASYIERCLSSLIKQTNFQLCQIILVNDGSTDNSDDLCQQYVNSYVNIQYISQRNSGAWAARYTGLKIATGKYTTFVDSDDYVESGFIEIAHQVLFSESPDLFCYLTSNQTPNNQNLSNIEPLNIHHFTSDEAFVTLGTHCGMPYNMHGVFFKTALLQNVYPTTSNVRRGEDVVVLAKYICECHTIITCDNNLYHYCMDNEQSVTHHFTTQDYYDLSQYSFTLSLLYAEKGYPDISLQYKKGYYDFLVMASRFARKSDRITSKQYRKEFLNNLPDALHIPGIKNKARYLLFVLGR